MTDLSQFWPKTGEKAIRGIFYTWAFEQRSLGMLKYAEGHGVEMNFKHISETREEFRDHLDEVARERMESKQWRAQEILEHGNPREFILNAFKTLHIGDNDTAEGILIGTMNQSIANSKGLQSAVHGESGYGKSHAARAMLHLHPEKYYMITSLSDKALFYMEANGVRPGMTIFCDDAKISEGIEGLIKRSTSAFQEETEHLVPMKEKGQERKTIELSIPPRIVWLLTSVDSQGSDQFVKRQISYGVDETSKQDERVIEFELEKARDGLPEFPVTDEVKICREIIAYSQRRRSARIGAFYG